MKRMREACNRIDRNRQFGTFFIGFSKMNGIPVVDGGCSAQVSPAIVSLTSRRVADPLVLDMDPTIIRYYNNREKIYEKEQEYSVT